MRKEVIKFEICKSMGAMFLKRVLSGRKGEDIPSGINFVYTPIGLFNEVFIKLDARVKPFTNENKSCAYSHYTSDGLYIYVNTHLYNTKEINKNYNSQYSEVPYHSGKAMLKGAMYHYKINEPYIDFSAPSFKIDGVNLNHVVGCGLAVSYIKDYLAEMKECFDMYNAVERRNFAMQGLSYSNIKKSVTYGLNYGLRRYPLIEEVRTILRETADKIKLIYEHPNETTKYKFVEFHLTYNRYRLQSVKLKWDGN